MSRYVFTIRTAADRARALRTIAKAPVGTRVEVKAVKRSLPQNDKFWAMLTDVSLQLQWHGKKLRPDDWKYLFMDALKRERRMMPNLDNDGFVDLGRSSADLTKEEMSDMLELVAAFGAKHGVRFHDEENAA